MIKTGMGSEDGAVAEVDGFGLGIAGVTEIAGGTREIQAAATLALIKRSKGGAFVCVLI